jgi:hypothetical protein
MTVTRFSSYFILNPILATAEMPVVKQMCAINEVGRRPDERELTPEKLTLRRGVSLPKGSTIWMKPELLRELIERGCVTGKEMEEVIAGLTFDGVEHKFTLYDLRTLLANSPNPLPENLNKDPAHVAVALVCEMYIQRYPYENDEANSEASA